MDGWPLLAQWALLLSLAVTFFGCTWWLAQRKARDEGHEASTLAAKTKVFTSSFGFSEWSVTVLFAVFLVPLAIRTLMA